MFDEDAARELAFRLTHLKYLLDNLEQSQNSEQERELIKQAKQDVEAASDTLKPSK